MTQAASHQTYPATAVYGADADAVLDALFTPGVDNQGKWASKWGVIRHRNRVVFATLKGTGLRIHEVCLMRPVDLDPKTNQLIVPRGKGGERRIIAISRQALDEIAGWLDVHRELGFTETDYLFPVIEGPTRGGMLSSRYLRKQVHAAGKRAQVQLRVAPHQWRHGVAVFLDRRKTSVEVIRRQLGHKSLATTMGYLVSLSNADVVDDVLDAFGEGES